MVNKKELVFEKSITRDWGIIYAEIWHKVFVQEFKKQIGWCYTEVIFEGENNNITIYRAPEEHMDGMREFILSKIDGDRFWLNRRAKRVKDKADRAALWIRSVEGRLTDYSQRELMKIFEKFLKINIDLGPDFIIMLWFPIQMEHREDAVKYRDAIDLAIKTREQIEKIGPLVDVFSRKIAQEVASRSGANNDLARFIGIKEVENYLRKGVIPSNRILSTRRQYFIVTNKGILSEKLDYYLKKQAYSLKKIDVSGAKIIKGSPAYPGKIKGVVRIIKNKDSFDKLNNGEILVTSMTTPDFLPIIKKAVAFITDEGGITCHAAIAAREMRKPCIIGTKIATQILKDGDLIEADADKGIINILNKE
jgi:phosphohistidine swiveling domain-containing protein